MGISSARNICNHSATGENEDEPGHISIMHGEAVPNSCLPRSPGAPVPAAPSASALASYEGGLSDDEFDVDDGADAHKSVPPGVFLGRRHSRNSVLRHETGVTIRVAGQSLADYMHVPVPHTAMLPGREVTIDNIRTQMHVVRGPGWEYGDQDGGQNQPGTVVAWDRQAETATVQWLMTGMKFDYYRIGNTIDLCEGIAQETRPSVFDDEPDFEFDSDSPDEAAGHPAVGSSAWAAHRAKGSRRNSQQTFSHSNQTVIIFDWDDTLFPTTYVKDDLGLNLRAPLDEQRLSRREKEQARNALAAAAACTHKLLASAATKGMVVLLTLAREPWVTDSCKFFYPRVGELIEGLGFQIVYAQKGKQVPYNKLNMMDEDTFDRYWSNLKGEAMKKVLESFYSQYEGQSWKNVISIGDSNFERLGTIAVTQNYAKEIGLGPEANRASGEAPETLTGSVANHEYKIRTKTLKLLDDPSDRELILQLGLMHKWLNDMVCFDDGFDIDLNTLDDDTVIASIEKKLKGGAVLVE